ncbi:hypothetical protein PLESTB_000714200 [Pleodorina starrii]|uniref:Uncharacterized protein n=1 Tax=Pleodorina starrii TaxID=330485 RepID=A0A9W6EXK2_9CHLO|nr:hypothetical protein PLESTB_000058300 [Pleodorina starrii]GLC53155.1 hypothetical protein PLESTB_000714200 [Pleodorina starrii]
MAASTAGIASVTSPRRAGGMITPRPRHAAAAEQLLAPGPGYQTPGAMSPLRGARTPLGVVMAPQSPPVSTCRQHQHLSSRQLCFVDHL